MKWDKRKLNNLLFAIGLAAVIIMMLTFDVSIAELWTHLCHTGYWLIPIIGIWAIIYFINALSWRSIIRSIADKDEHVGLWDIYGLTISGYALNYATPVGGLGGEPYRIMELTNYMSKQHASSSVILYAMMHIFAHFCFWFSSVFLYLALVGVGDLTLSPFMKVFLALMVVLCLIAFYLFAKGYRKGLVVKTIRWIGKVPGLRKWSSKTLEKHSESLHRVDEQIGSLHQQDKRSFYTSLSLEYLSRIVQSLEVMFMLLLFGIDCGGGAQGLLLTFLHSILIVAFTSLLSNLIGFLPMQLGVQEGGFVASIAVLKLAASLGIFIGIICRFREIVWIIIGLILMKLRK